MNIVNTLSLELNIKPWQIENTIELIDAGNTIPFIARYRKEQTGELSDTQLRELGERLEYLRNLENRKAEVIRLIDEQGKLTDELKAKIEAAKVLQEVEDLYRPYRPKKRTRASIAKEKGLEPLAQLLWEQKKSNESLEEIASQYINRELGVETWEDALKGAMDIIAEDISDNADYRKFIRELTFNLGTISTKGLTEEKSEYQMYYDFAEPIKKIPSHRVLAINRGEKEKMLSVKIDAPKDRIIPKLEASIIIERSPYGTILSDTALDSYDRLIAPSIEREIRNELTEKAEEQAIKVFGTNLKNLLLQPPIKGKSVMGFDPAYRTGCKIAVLDDTGKLLDTTTVYATPPQNKVEEAKEELKKLIKKHNVEIISLGNGTASRESEKICAEIIKETDKPLHYIVVNEAGASVYSASELAAKEYPDVNVSLRGAISIGRRLQDPLAELVKIDPKSIGVGQYQHDVSQKNLSGALNAVVEDCVNSVGVDLNTATPSLLQYVSGINSAVAKNLVAYREEVGKFKSRKELLKVKKLGEKAFEQCAGFLRIPESQNILDNTAVHPESYEAATILLEKLGCDKSEPKSLAEALQQVNGLNVEKLSEEIGVGVPTLRDIIKELQKPGRDPRDEMPKPIFHTDVLEMKDLKPGMILTGTVRNVIDFGAFVDIGVHQDGLVHISELADKFVRRPMEVVQVGDIVKVKVLEVDLERSRISLSMKGLN
ncbi:Tex family protein [Lutispora sp.]|uniref:Tex family protein n=1 Tax=Lutispora sp. TaxID=2828727 RepID=UPI002B20B109|nr:Tex family protein [Lutispora sp.]MEA4963351.1 Tex family protein [Lutispora sp.]